MRLILKMMIPLTALVFALACGDDDGDPGDDGDNGDDTADDNGDDTDDTDDTDDDNGEGGGGGGGNEPSPACKGTYSMWTAAQVEEKATAGACQEDTAEVCARDLSTDAGIAGQACFADFPNDPEGLAGCALERLKEGHEANPSDACLGCYLASVDCVRRHCLEQCLGEPNGQVCVQCRYDEGCTTDFFECSGLPSPLPPP